MKEGKLENFFKILPKNEEDLELTMKTVLCQECKERREIWHTDRSLVSLKKRLEHISEYLVQIFIALNVINDIINMKCEVIKLPF